MSNYVVQITEVGGVVTSMVVTSLQEAFEAIKSFHGDGQIPDLLYVIIPIAAE